MKKLDIIKTLNNREPRSFRHEADVVWKAARNWSVWDSSARKYIDFTSSIFVANSGHCRIGISNAIRSQELMLISSYAFPTEVRAKLVEKLCTMTGFEKCFLLSTGSEAVEAAIRCVNGYFLTIKGAFHGNTMGSKYITEDAVTSGGVLTYDRYPDTPIHKWDIINPARTGAILFETYLGYNAQFHPKDWVQAWCKWAKENDILVGFDEIQAGFGRTGKMWGYEHYEVEPDFIVIGKGLGGGLPISALLGSAEMLDRPNDLSSTHSGNPVCCAAALANIDIIEKEKLWEAAYSTGRELGGYLKEQFPDYHINGKGMIWAILGVENSEDVVDRCADKGLLLVKTRRDTIKIGPPLITPIDVCKEGVDILKSVMSE